MEERRDVAGGDAFLKHHLGANVTSKSLREKLCSFNLTLVCVLLDASDFALYELNVSHSIYTVP